LVNIDSALLLIRLPRRDDVDDFIAIIFVLAGIRDYISFRRKTVRRATSSMIRSPWREQKANTSGS
jgi:hypothetical protein